LRLSNPNNDMSANPNPKLPQISAAVSGIRVK